ncbi:MAG: hypothetical protein HOI47_21605 [Candidatus Scalindua sp.]|jgi:hypothetical protein|nr:hypothetical protein [Candidatus Scalindua sp.]
MKMIDTIQEMIYGFERDKGVVPTEIFIPVLDYLILKEEAEPFLLNEKPQDRELMKICGLAIEQTYSELGVYLES